jgi:hypothetical protein
MNAIRLGNLKVSKGQLKPLVAKVAGSSGLVRHPPFLEPFEVSVLLIWPLHAKADRDEHHIQSDDDGIQHGIDAPLHRLVQLASAPVQAEAGGEDCKVERGIVVVYVSDTSHGDEGIVVKEPADNGIQTSVVELIDFGGFEVGIAALPTDEVPGYHEGDNAKGGCRAPVDKWVAEEEVFCNCDTVNL